VLFNPRNVPVLALILVALLPATSATADEPATQASAVPMEKYASQDAIFVVYKPQGWVVTEGAQPTFRTISIADPTGGGEAAMFLGTSPTGADMLALTKRFLGGIGQQFPDLQILAASVSNDKHRVAVSASFTYPTTGKREFRCWVSGRGDEFIFESIETPAGAFNRTRPLLLTILSNVRVFKGAFAASGAAPAPLPVLVPHQLSDGSASFRMPQDWGCKELGKGNFVAGDQGGQHAFIVASVDVMTPRLGVNVPGVPVAPYQSPSRAMQTLTAWQGAASNMKFESVIPRKDVADQMAQVYTSGPITVEEFIYTCDTKAGKTKGYTFGFTFGSRTDTNWNFRHLTVMAPAGGFNAALPAFEAMLRSYQINDEWARSYVEQGMARLRQLQQQTSAMVARNAREIHDMMQAAYDERQRSQDYIDYQRTSYIRGEQDWVSGMEGGTVYHTDSWGTRNTTTGETWAGQPYDYVNFAGRNPQHNEDMTPIDSRALWEQHIAR
jgi:hypothetical protein